MDRRLRLDASRRKPLAVLAQLSHPLNDRNHWFCNKENVPLAAGYLRAMARARGLTQAVDVALLEPELSDRAGDAALAQALLERGTDLLGLSLYPWNLTRSLALARTLRSERPDIVLVGGGPEVNEATLPALLGGGLLDVAVPGEGEVTFSELLRALLDGDAVNRLPGAVVLREGELRRGPSRPTLVDLDEIPSPYLEGDINVDRYRQVHMLYERGCIYACKFCHWWPDRRSRGRFSLERIEREIAHLRASKVREVVLLDASINTSRGFEALCDVLERTNGDHRLLIKVQVLFDHLDRRQLERLARCGVRHLEIGLQSADPQTLRRIQRPTEIEAFNRALTLADGLPLDLQVDFMIGLPGDTAASVEATCQLIREATLRRRIAQVSPFLLSVGSPSRLRGEAEALGLRYQPEPPYRVLASGELDYRQLRRLRARVPELLGAGYHPCFDHDQPHYALNFFEPELALASGDTFVPRPPRPGTPRGDLLDGVQVRCAATAPGHPHPFVPELVAPRLSGVATLWFACAKPEACAAHLVDAVTRLSTPNPYAVWDLVLEAEAGFDLELLDALAAAVRYQVHNVDWDNYLVNVEEAGGFARLATRLILIVPAGGADPAWLARAAGKAALVHSLRVDHGDPRAAIAAAAAAPGEGVLVDLAPEAEATAALAAVGAVAALDCRVRGFRNHALKTLVELERARRRKEPRPRLPYFDRTVLVHDEGSSAMATSRLTARESLLDASVLAARLRRQP